MPTKCKINIIVPITIKKVVATIATVINRNNLASLSGSLRYCLIGSLLTFTPLNLVLNKK
jgi:hypothetical protein